MQIKIAVKIHRVICTTGCYIILLIDFGIMPETALQPFKRHLWSGK